MPLVAVGVSHKTAPIEVREQLAFTEADLATAAARIRSLGLATEALVVSTCNRVELYAASPSGDPAALAQQLRGFLARDRGHSGDLSGIVYTHQGTAALEHLFRVVSGLDSLVLGETEILGQIKRFYSVALAAGSTGGILNRSFQRAFAMAKRVRTETQIQRGNTSVAAVAVELAERIFDDLDRRQVMVIGAGDTSEKTARALRGRGAKGILVSNRSFDRAAALAEELDGRAIGFQDWEHEFAAVDIVISATGSPHPILDRDRLERLMAGRRPRPILLIDLAVPRDIDPAVTLLPEVFLANVDDLQSVADTATRQRREEVARCETMIREAAAEFDGGRRFGPFALRSPSA